MLDLQRGDGVLGIGWGSLGFGYSAVWWCPLPEIQVPASVLSALPCNSDKMFKEQLGASKQLLCRVFDFWRQVTNKGHLIYKILPLCQLLSFLPHGPRVSFEQPERLHSPECTRLRLPDWFKATLMRGTGVLCTASTHLVWVLKQSLSVEQASLGFLSQWVSLGRVQRSARAALASSAADCAAALWGIMQSGQPGPVKFPTSGTRSQPEEDN